MEWGATLGGLDDQLTKIMARNQMAQKGTLDIVNSIQDVRNQSRTADRLDKEQAAQQAYWEGTVGARAQEAQARIQALADKNATLEEKQAAIDAWAAMPEGPEKDQAGAMLLKYGVKVLPKATEMVDILDRSGKPTGQKVPKGSMWTPAPPQTNISMPIISFDPASGEMTTVGSAPKGARIINVPRESPTAMTAQADITQAKNIINDLDKMSAGLMQSNNWIGKMTAGAKQAGGSMLNMDDAAKQYEVTRDGFLATVSRLTGERGVLTDQDVARARLLLPAFGDSKNIRDKKIRELKNLLDEKEKFWKAKQPVLATGSKSKPKAAGAGDFDPDAYIDSVIGGPK